MIEVVIDRWLNHLDMLVIIRQIVPWVKSLPDVIQQMCSLSQEFAGCHPANVPLVESSLDIIRQLQMMTIKLLVQICTFTGAFHFLCLI